MVVVDSSALIPLAWFGRLDLVSTTFEEIQTTNDVHLHPQVYAQVQKKLRELGA